MAVQNAKILGLFRQLFREFKHADAGWRQSEELKFVKRYTREHKLTQQLLGKGPNEVEYMASCYTSYLTSSRKLAQMQAKYVGNEKTVEQSANLVGLTLPERKM